MRTDLFHENHMYRNVNTLDADLYVTKVVEETDIDITLNVKYFNRFYLLFMGDPDTVVIKKSDYDNWKSLG